VPEIANLPRRVKDYKPPIDTKKTHAGRSRDPVNSILFPYPSLPASVDIQTDALSIAVIGPDVSRRMEAASAVASCGVGEIRQFPAYPPVCDVQALLIEPQFDVVVIDMESDPECALDLVESICGNSPATVMVYTSRTDPDVLVRCMRAGAREFLTLPFAQNLVADALVRAAARRPVTRKPKKTRGKLLVFLGAKGGAGVTTLACNMAVALAQEQSQKTLLIDLDLPLGDAALSLGIVPEFSTVSALQATDRLDGAFLSKLLSKHSSGVSILAAPGKFPRSEPTGEAIDKLLAVARQEFDYVVVDVGSRLDPQITSLFQEAARIYLVTQAGIAELRNTNRLISQFFSEASPKLEVVINRYEPRAMGVSEEHITKALTRPAKWKVPNDHVLVRRNQISATPLVLGDSSLARRIRQIAASITGQVEAPKKKRFGLFG
jgi:pilus assembly protein CpaE